MKSTYHFIVCLLYSIALCFGLSHDISAQEKPNNYIAEAKAFLTAIRNKENTDIFVKAFANCNIEQLSQQVETDEQKLAFWLNMYNAYIQNILTKNPEKYNDRGSFFKDKQLNIGGKLFSFADIEHGILRHSQHELFLGYITRPFPDNTEKMLRVKKRNWHIHFALNCGAKSCPPVAIYDESRIDEQLGAGAKKYLTAFTSYRKEENTAYVTSLFSWFRGDFNGIKGIKEILLKFHLIPDTSVRLKTSEYDWTLDLGNFVDL
jgi:hypothetical protein